MLRQNKVVVELLNDIKKEKIFIMTDEKYIRKENDIDESEDYYYLRKKGLAIIEKLGKEYWSDYNLSDPGITIFDALCYAITDLGYRAGFEIKDILTKQRRGQNVQSEIFYTARKILYNKPLTINDYRKIVLDVPGVRNAWIQVSKNSEVPLIVDSGAIRICSKYNCDSEDIVVSLCFGKLRLSPCSDEQRKDECAELYEKIKNLETYYQKRKNILKDVKDDKFTIDAQKKIDIRIADLDDKKKYIQKICPDVVGPDNYYRQENMSVKGLYDVLVEYDEAVLKNKKYEEVREKIYSRLIDNRGLCEDIGTVTAIEYEDIGINADVEIDEYADPDKVLAEILYEVQYYLNPGVNYYTLEEMIAKGYQVEEIFQGPLLSSGFIDQKEFEKRNVFGDVQVSDIMRCVLGVDGVKNIIYLRIVGSSDIKERQKDDGEYGWVYKINKDKTIPRLIPEMSKIRFKKSSSYILYNTGSYEDRSPMKMMRILSEIGMIKSKSKLRDYKYDYDVPQGEYMDLEEYIPVMELLPMCYKVSDRFGESEKEDSCIKNESLQLKGYLMAYEQVFLNSLCQLSHIKELFSFDEVSERTYYSRYPEEIKSVDKIIINRYSDEMNQLMTLKEKYEMMMHEIIEPEKVYLDRRNRILDHMLARFAEDMSEYESIMRLISKDDISRRIIKDKADILRNGEYENISSARGSGFNYVLNENDKKQNISGFQRRLYRLLGIEERMQRMIVPEYIIVDAVVLSDGFGNLLQFKKDEMGNVLQKIEIIRERSEKNEPLLLSEEVKGGECCDTLIKEIMMHASKREFYHFKTSINKRSKDKEKENERFWYELRTGSDPDKSELLGVSIKYKSKMLCYRSNYALRKLVACSEKIEGFYLIEHILLRPRVDEILDESGKNVSVSLFDINLKKCVQGKIGDVKMSPYRRLISRVPANKCFEKMSWALEYLRYDYNDKKYNKSVLFQYGRSAKDEKELLRFKTYENLVEYVEELQFCGSDKKNYQIMVNDDDKYCFIIYNNDGVEIAWSGYVYDMKSDAMKEVGDIVEYFNKEYDLKMQSEEESESQADPYSFTVSIVIPDWPERFRDSSFRLYVENTIRRELPAHIYPQIFWVGVQQMRKFEKIYYEWLAEMSQNTIPSSMKCNPLVDIINEMKMRA